MASQNSLVCSLFPFFTAVWKAMTWQIRQLLSPSSPINTRRGCEYAGVSPAASGASSVLMESSLSKGSRTLKMTSLCFDSIKYLIFPMLFGLYLPRHSLNSQADFINSCLYKVIPGKCSLLQILLLLISLDTWAAVVADGVLAAALGTRHPTRSLKSRVRQRLGLLTHTW